MKAWATLVLVGIVICVIWLFAPGIALRFSAQVGDSVSELGATGDLFGAVSALFNGFAFLGVIVVLAYEMNERKKDLARHADLAEERRQEMRPFITASIEEFAFSEAKWKESECSCEVNVGLRFENASPDIALNVTSTVCVELTGGEARQTNSGPIEVGMPLTENQPSKHSGRFSLHANDAKDFLELIRSSSGATLSVDVYYNSLNGTKWFSSVAFDFSVKDSEKYRVDEILKKNVEYYVSGGFGANSPAIEYSVRSGSWKQEVVRGLPETQDTSDT